MKPIYRRSWAGNLLMFSDFTLGSSQGQTMVHWLWRVVFCISSPMRRSSFVCIKIHEIMHQITYNLKSIAFRAFC